MTGARSRPRLDRQWFARLKVALAKRPVLVRARRRFDKRLPDLEIRQLRALQRAYSGQSGPDVLVFGDSAMFWTRGGESDMRSLAAMMRDELGEGVSIHTIVGPGYNPRIVMALLRGLADCPSRPKVVVVPTSLMMATGGWQAHPSLSYETEAAGLIRIIEDGDVRAKRLPRATGKDWDTYDRLPAASLFGARRTYGEIRMIINAIPSSAAGLPTTNWQQFVRIRHLLDLANAERLAPETVGVRLIADLAESLNKLQLRSVAYISPVNHEVMAKVLGPAARDHLTSNADVVETAYRSVGGELATVVNAAFACSASDFCDPLHLNELGRKELASRLVDAVRRQLTR